MSTKGVIIQASSRSKGNTHKIVSFFQQQTGFDFIDLKTKKIAHFDYEFKNSDDDFNKLFKEIAAKYDTIVFATPIYWYTMSGILKVFLDRISDFLFHEKEFGRMLREKEMVVISCGSEDQVFKGFTMPFLESANYLGMHFLGHIHTWIEKDVISEIAKNRINEFISTQLIIKRINN